MKRRHSIGYPPFYLRAHRRYAVVFIVVLLAMGTVAGVASYHAIASDLPLEFAVAPTALLLFAGWFFYHSVLRSKIGLMPYFESKVEGASVWSEAMARNCVYLDQICRHVNVATLSSFGFTDDWSGKTMVWHDAQSGLQTIEALVGWLRCNPAHLLESTETLADLQRIKDRLQTASENSVRFCLILHGNAWNGMEIEQRCGHF